MAWIALVAAGLFEVLGVLAIKRVTTFRDPKSYALLAVAFLSSFSLLTLAMGRISMGTSYAVWTGIGTAGGTLLGMFAFGEPKEWRRVFCIGLIAASAIGLKIVS
ncbi:DMT family transporter [Paenibacillus flagellatus]|uniref:QacE family quaternary ammonium compound efflux SMR transporter n=1 Tax=Paenibacillus flagellatus TaxID=2211139 RepID=A0A2V5KDY8_9BACL|nr:multidrug efflux SMR transporter [Paenibacillus flagellatus]PYI52170.1 QacE family quaternary ammonium compound efflux SMR transporter [Paenibacillus flagellatus]